MELDTLVHRHNEGDKLSMYFAVRYRLERQKDTKLRMPCHIALEGKQKSNHIYTFNASKPQK